MLMLIFFNFFNFLTFQIILRQETEQTEGVKNSPISEHRCCPEKVKLRIIAVAADALRSAQRQKLRQKQ